MLDQYRREYADFNTAWMREHYLFLSGQKTSLEIAPIYERYSDLFSRDSINRLKQSLDDTPEHFEAERVSIKHLLMFAIDHLLDDSAKNLTEEICRFEAVSTIESKDRQITFHESAVAVSTEPDRAARRAIYDRRIALIEASNDLRAERLGKLYDTARSLNYPSYTALYQDLFGLNYDELARDCESLLARTESVYVTRLNDALSRDLGIKLEEAERPDASYFLHLTHYDEQFPASELLPVYAETMAGLGISVESQNNIVIDSEMRPHKHSRAFCAPVIVPGEIKLVICPSGGQSDYLAFFHEAGHAQHYAWTSAALRPEFRYTGDPALTETYAFLLNYLCTEQEWLSRLLGFRENRDFARSAMLAKLLMVRRYAAKLIYERELHTTADLARAAALYDKLQTDATKFKSGQAEFLFDLDDSFYSASYLRAWAFEVALREYLKSRFNRQWWTSARAGNFLKEVWETGERYTADEIASQIGLGPITFDLLADEFNQSLR